MTDSKEAKSRLNLDKYQLYVEIVTDILQTQNPEQLKALKNFLHTLPSPWDIELVLTEAVDQLEEIDLDTRDWILKHPDYLLPELNLVSVAQNLVKSILTKQGLLLGADFHFTTTGQLEMNTTAEMTLFSHSSETEYTFIQQSLTNSF
ncbi:MAG: hypothetical protein WBA13_02360 [Microcoleaceae cyanobacterium]